MQNTAHMMLKLHAKTAHIFFCVSSRRMARFNYVVDFKMNINQAAKLDKFPLPWIEDLFAALAGG